MSMTVEIKDTRKFVIIDYVSTIIDVHDKLFYEWEKKKKVTAKSINECNLAVFGEISARLAEALKNEVSIVVPQTLQEVINPVNSSPGCINVFSERNELLIYRTRLKISDIGSISSKDENLILTKLRDKLALMEYHKELDELKKDIWDIDYPDFTVYGITFTNSYINIDWCLVNEYCIIIK